MLVQIVVLGLLLVFAAVVLVGSIVYRVHEIRDDAAAWDALITRTRGNGGTS